MGIPRASPIPQVESFSNPIRVLIHLLVLHYTISGVNNHDDPSGRKYVQRNIVTIPERRYAALEQVVITKSLLILTFKMHPIKSVVAIVVIL